MGGAQAQRPFAVLFGCSDSRLAAEIIFDRGPGDLFVVRTAGHVTGSEVLGSIEYGVDVLGCPLVVVLGHDSCGAVGAACAALEEGMTPARYIRDVIERATPSVLAARAAGRIEPERSLPAESTARPAPWPAPTWRGARCAGDGARSSPDDWRHEPCPACRSAERRTESRPRASTAPTSGSSEGTLLIPWRAWSGRFLQGGQDLRNWGRMRSAPQELRMASVPVTYEGRGLAAQRSRLAIANPSPSSVVPATRLWRCPLASGSGQACFEQSR